MLKLKLLIFVENGNLFSYKFDQPCFSIFYVLFKNEQECFIRFKTTSAQREWL